MELVSFILHETIRAQLDVMGRMEYIKVRKMVVLIFSFGSDQLRVFLNGSAFVCVIKCEVSINLQLGLVLSSSCKIRNARFTLTLLSTPC